MAWPLIKPKQPLGVHGLFFLFPQQVRRPGCRRAEGTPLAGTGAAGASLQGRALGLKQVLEAPGRSQP